LGDPLLKQPKRELGGVPGREIPIIEPDHDHKVQPGQFDDTCQTAFSHLLPDTNLAKSNVGLRVQQFKLYEPNETDEPDL
jgi:hypothetical protein